MGRGERKGGMGGVEGDGSGEEGEEGVLLMKFKLSSTNIFSPLLCFSQAHCRTAYYCVFQGALRDSAVVLTLPLAGIGSPCDSDSAPSLGLALLESIPCLSFS